jgi:hypothetical protein
MSRGETTSEAAQAAGLNRQAEGGPPEERLALTDIEVPPMIQKAIERHRRDLPELMKRHAYQWAAYRGEERLEIGKSKQTLYHKRLDRGLNPHELVVLGIGPEIPDAIGGDELLDV